MPLATVGLDIDQGEDWTCQIVLTGQTGDAMNVIGPMQMDLRNQVGQLVLSLNDPQVGDTGIPEITYSSDIGLIQIHIKRSVTAALEAGEYQYDLFCTVTDYDIYAGNQRLRVLNGSATVNKRVTEM